MTNHAKFVMIEMLDVNVRFNFIFSDGKFDIGVTCDIVTYFSILFSS